MKANNPSAYRIAPWRKQMQRIITILLLTFAAACVTLVYLSISERMTDINMQIQALQEERAEYSRNIAALTTDEGILTSYKTMQERAARAGFTEIDFDDEDQYTYVIIDGYTGTGINTEEHVQETSMTEVVSLIKPEYTQSLQDWLYNRISTGIESYEVTN
ncbi:MAG: hypothetical protein II969_07990 [Anaerolineaceae bacterium]|nr:hypothetical protein [Anaerolineaceae bacterium]